MKLCVLCVLCVYFLTKPANKLHFIFHESVEKMSVDTSMRMIEQFKK